jgi:hypothetical protein
LLNIRRAVEPAAGSRAARIEDIGDALLEFGEGVERGEYRHGG